MHTLTSLLADDPFYIAHRGGSARWPEMTLRAYAHAVAAGYKALELSLARTCDGVWFGLHDATLDRTSGTTGAEAATMTWEQVQRHTVQGEPYARLEAVLAAYAGTHVLLIDPKKGAAHRAELFALLQAQPHWQEHLVVKSSAKAAWPVGREARAAGFTTWGFYYHHNGTLDTLATTHHDWSWLGLNHDAPQAAWDRITRCGKPVIGHIVRHPEERDTALAKGARGIMSAIPDRIGP